MADLALEGQIGHHCSGCRGAGMRMITRQIGPGMIQQMNTVCPECRGSGEMISDKDRCPSCRGNKVTQEKKVLEVHVEKGMQHGQKIVFQGEADEAPDTVTGDIVFVLQLKEHPKFKRKSDDLFVEHTISLTEALCGFQFVLTHLDGRQLLIKSNPGEIIKPGQPSTPCFLLFLPFGLRRGWLPRRGADPPIHRTRSGTGHSSRRCANGGKAWELAATYKAG
uniref:Predicted protein n=1 Tax=Hordeum vulgare subsp. vulgare TaxID=112509 RepID=F2CTZ2_HORVV|nr:predicted protein [Hordeum vulgare subsp. vulgare]